MRTKACLVIPGSLHEIHIILLLSFGRVELHPSVAQESDVVNRLYNPDQDDAGSDTARVMFTNVNTRRKGL